MTQLVMPRLYDGIARHQPDFIAWRWAFFVPGALHIIMALLVIFFAQVRNSRSICAPCQHPCNLICSGSASEGGAQDRRKPCCLLPANIHEK